MGFAVAAIGMLIALAEVLESEIIDYTDPDDEFAEVRRLVLGVFLLPGILCGMGYGMYFLTSDCGASTFEWIRSIACSQNYNTGGIEARGLAGLVFGGFGHGLVGAFFSLLCFAIVWPVTKVFLWGEASFSLLGAFFAALGVIIELLGQGKA